VVSDASARAVALIKQTRQGATDPRLNGSRADLDAPDRTDLGNAQQFAADHRERIRHVRERKMWLAYDGSRWARDKTGDADRAAKNTVRLMLERAVTIDDADERKAAVQWALRSQAEARLSAMLSLAATEPEIVLTVEELDRHPTLLSCANGTVDLRTGGLRDHDPADLITLGTNVVYDPNAECPRWLEFLDELFPDDRELITFVQHFVGYCLTGDTREHVLAVLHGSGCNGKSTFIAVLKQLLGGHAVTAAFDTFMRQRDRGPRNDLARLHRARLVTAAESGEGRRLDEATVKEITGGDTIAARFLFAEYFEYVPQFKLMLVTNHRPRVDGDDDAIWRRLRLIPFEQSFEGREDRELSAKLTAELPGILAWAVAGCLAWQQDGLGDAAAVTRATSEYRQDEDVLGAFLLERCVTTGDVDATTFREAYAAYCQDVGERPLAANVLGKRLSKRGIRRERQTDGERRRIYRGVSLR
jgi:putative DNA primase/helicase